MKLVVITPSKDVADEPSLATKMFESGLRTLHLRKPRYSTAQMKDYIRDIPAHFHDRIVIHSHHDLALKFHLKGIHISRHHLSRKWSQWFLRWRLRLKFKQVQKTRSYSKLQQTYNTEEREFDYYLIGTMFNSMTGELYSGFYEEGVIAANRNCGKNLVARGGTIPKCIEKARSYGFYGIAFNSYIWGSETPYANFLGILEEFRRLNIEPE
jgi:thiamine-phosphate pyrophosphorylase